MKKEENKQERAKIISELDIKFNQLVEAKVAESRSETLKEIEVIVEEMIRNPLLTQHNKKAGMKAELESLKRHLTRIQELKE